MSDFISVSDALDLLEEHTFVPQKEKVYITECEHRYLAAPMLADRDFPPYDRVTMDGIAISFKAGVKEWKIEQMAAAGSPQKSLAKEDHAIEVMTGSILPSGTDTVIRYEDIRIEDNVASLKENVSVQSGQNIHYKGSDLPEGNEIVPRLTKISPAEIALAATVGLESLMVYTMPSLAIISTGDELVKITDAPEPHQIRSSNSHMIASFCHLWRIPYKQYHISDDKQETRQTIEHLLQQHRILLFLGGSSKGKFDFIPKTLEELGVEKVFYKIRQRPGKPFWFGHYRHAQFVFALPGNPVSAFVCFRYYFQHWMMANMRVSAPKRYAVLNETVHFKPDLTYFIPVSTSSEGNQVVALPVATNGSGDHAALARADALMILPAEESTFHPGQSFPIIPYR